MQYVGSGSASLLNTVLLVGCTRALDLRYVCGVMSCSMYDPVRLCLCIHISILTLQGIVKTLKDSFGFIERADVVKDVS